MNTTRNRNRWNLRRLAVPATLALAMTILPGAVTQAEAHGPQGKGYKKAHKWDHKHAAHAVAYQPARFAPVYVNYYRPRVVRPAAFYLSAPYVMVHGPRIDARVAYYPAGAPLYEPGYCPSEVHYHPYHGDDHVDVDVQARVNVHIDF